MCEYGMYGVFKLPGEASHDCMYAEVFMHKELIYRYNYIGIHFHLLYYFSFIFHFILTAALICISMDLDRMLLH
jgi:hypothetical protein